MESFLAVLALIGAVIVVSALLSGWVDRTGVPQVAVFLAMGFLIGPGVLGLLDASVESDVLRVVATLSLVLVLFTDGVSLDLSEIRGHKLLAGLVLGPGTLLSAVLIAGAAWYLLGLSAPLSAILGAALASTDPVLLRGLLRRPALHNSVRQALRLESGLNDVVLLPIVLVAMAILTSTEPLTGGEWGRLALSMLVLSPGAGVAVGLIGVKVLEQVRKRSGVRRDYESIYSIGLAFTAYAAAESLHGSGFIAAFAAGLTISVIDVELCDCFLEYGETTAEMALLFTFVLFGTSIIWGGLAVIGPATISFTIAALLLRPIAFLPALIPAPISWRSRALIAWFGPRGLSSLLLVLLAVFSNIDGSEYLLQVCCLVVLVSVVLHGFSPMVLIRGEVTDKPSAFAQGASTFAPSASVDKSADKKGLSPQQGARPKTLAVREVLHDRPRAHTITIDDFVAMKESGAPVVLVDSRTERAFDDGDPIPDSVRVRPDHAVADAVRHELPSAATLVVFCA
ncbi:MAG: cation:proton antiporter [Acidobacteriota bacterium]|nr:cation:proton antiporter [Acidobacteriota bacterium]